MGELYGSILIKNPTATIFFLMEHDGISNAKFFSSVEKSCLKIVSNHIVVEINPRANTKSKLVPKNNALLLYR
jgi:hypothetical protein